MAFIDGPSRVLAGIFVLTSIACSNQLGREDDERNVYDRTCFVPPSERPRGASDSELLAFNFSSVVPLSYEYLSFPNGTCGIDLYLRVMDRYLPASNKDLIQKLARNAVPTYCSYSDASMTAQPMWSLRFLTTGSLLSTNNTDWGPDKLVPERELRRVPHEWRNDIVVYGHMDYISATGRQKLLCSVNLFQGFSQFNYNANITFQINGCPSGRYGGQCEQNCSCAEGVECHSFNGVCMCPQGLRGTRCNKRDPHLTVQLQQIYVLYGETFNLTCTAYGMSPSSWSWTKDGQATPLMTTKQQEITPYTPRPVFITTTLDAHNTSVNGGYTCEVQDHADGSAYSQHVNVTIIAIPDPFIGLPKDQTALIGNNATFTCKTKADTGTVKWVRGRNLPSSKGAELTDRIGRYEIRQPSVGVSELHIYGVQFADEGVYRCFVGHIFLGPDLAFAEARLDVISDPQPDCSFQGIVSAQSGHSLTLQCLIERAMPAPKLAWNIEDRETTPEPVIATYTKLSDDTHSWNVNTSMTFVPVPEDDGKRVSVALVSPAWEGVREVTATLNISYIPIISISPNPITLSVGQDATITCQAQANPEPTSYVWRLVHPNKSSSIDTNSKGPTYFIKNVNKECDKARLTCQVGNTIGETQMSVLMKVTDSRISSGAKIAFSVSGGLCLAVLLLASILARCYRKEITLWWAKRVGKDNKGDKEFDVFISYKSGTPDEEFVVGELIPRLEKEGYRICVHYRYFMPGRSIIDNIADAVHCSRKTLLVLSPGFVESEWCRYKFQAALSEMLHLQTDLIPVIFKDLGPPENLTEDLRTMLQTLSYITWPGSDLNGQPQMQDDKERFWKLLLQSLPETPLGQEEPTSGTDVEMDRYVDVDIRQELC